MAYLGQGGAKRFKDDTKKTVAGKGPIKIKVSGSNLVPIIAALEHYEATLQKPLIQRQGALCSVISKCKKWLDLKQAKVGSTQDPQATVKLRQARVSALMNEAWQALQQSDGGQMKHAFEAYSARKAAGAHQTRGLAPGYTTERAAYLQSGKTKSVSGSLVDDLLEKGSTRNQTLPNPKVKVGNQFQDNPARAAAIARNQALKAKVNKNTKGRPLASLTPADYKKIEKAASAIPGGIETKYMKRPERLKCMLESDGDGGLRYAVGARSAATVAPQSWPYAMDEWGNIYTANDTTDASKGGYAMFNHSSFTAGDDIVCAGMLEIDAAGKLIFIDTNSGHYKPTAEQLRAVLVILRDEYHVDLQMTEVSLPMPEPRKIWGVGEVKRFLAGQPPLTKPNKALPQLPP